MTTKQRKDQPKGNVLKLRLTGNDLERARLAALAETEGNVSEFVRRAVDEKIGRVLRAA